MLRLTILTSLCDQEAFITYSYVNGVVTYNQSAAIVFREISNLELKSGHLFENAPGWFSTEFQKRLETCKQGKLQRFSYQLIDHSLEIIFSPILNEGKEIDQVSIAISVSLRNEGMQDSFKDESQADQELEYNKQIYSNLFYNNPDAVFSFDLEGNFVNANLISSVLAETSREELLKMNFLPFIPEEDQEKVLKHFEEAKKGNEQSFETRFRSVKGTRKILAINNFPIRYNDKIIGVYGIAKDITLQKETESRILEERHMLRAIIDNIPDYIFVKDREHKSILSNRKFYSQILGKTSDDSSKGYSPLDYFDSEKGRQIIADNELVMNNALPVINRPDTVTNIEGKEEMVLLTKVPLKNQNEEIIGLVGIARDITETYLHNKKQELIFKIVKAFGDHATFQDAMIRTLKILCEDLEFEYAESYKISVNNKHLIRSAFWSTDQDLSNDDVTYSKGQGLPGRVWETGKVEVIRQEDGTGLLRDMILDSRDAIKSAVGIPIIFQGKLISIFCLGSVKGSKTIEKELLGDITLQIASAIERKSSQEQLNDFYTYSPNMIAVVGMDGFMKQINPSFQEKFGYSANEILTKPFTDFIHPGDLPKTFEAINNLSVGGQDFELRCQKKDGEYLWISCRFSRFFEKENVVFVYGTDITPLKNVQKELEESERKYRSLFDASPLPMWVLDRENLRFLKVNKAALDIYGYSEEEFSSMTVKDLWAPEQEEDIEGIVAENMDDFFQVKVRHHKKNGEYIYVNVNSNPVIFDGIEARVSLIKDVTARIEAERMLYHSEQRFKALVQDGSDLISILDSNYNYVYNSPAAKTVFGIDPSALIGTNFTDYIHQDDLNQVKTHISKLRSNKRLQLPSYRVKGPENNWRWIETIITNLQDEPAINGIVMNSRDITEFVEQERELLESLKRYDIVAKATSDIITDYDIEKDEMQVSEAAFKVFGYRNEDGIYPGRWWKDNIHPDDSEKVNAAADQMMMNNKKNLTIEYRFKCADGTYKYILDRSYLITDENSTPKRIIGSMQDITERKNHLIAIENHNERLREIAWTQSHVVRAPLAKVMGLVDLLLNYKEDLEDVDHILENVLKSANELDGIIRNIAFKTEKEL